MTAHLFAIGARVNLSLSARGAAVQADVFVVKACLPVIGTRLQYRIRTPGEPFDRVVVEELLTSLPSEGLPQI